MRAGRLGALASLAAVLMPVMASARSEGTVTIRVLDENGRTIDCAIGGFLDIDSQANLKSLFDGLRGTHIPYGTYVYSLWRRPPGNAGAVIEGRVRVSMPETLSITTAQRFVLTSALVAADGFAPGSVVVKGRLEPMPTASQSTTGLSGELVWIRLSPVMGDAPNLDIEVDPSGEFHFYGPLGGRYLLVVNRGKEVLHVELLKFPLKSAEPLVIKLQDTQARFSE